MVRMSEVVGGAGVIFAVGGLLLNQEAQLVTRFFNIAVIAFALTPVVREIVMRRLTPPGPPLNPGQKAQFRARTLQYIFAMVILFSLPSLSGFVTGRPIIPFWNYGTLLAWTVFILYFLYWFWEEAQKYSTYATPVVAIVGIGIFAGGAFLVPWAQVQGPAGAFGSTVESSVGAVTSSVGTAAEYSYNTFWRKNRQVARLQCIMEHGGPTGIAFTPSSEISKCVQQKMGQNQTITDSNRVTEPIEVAIDDLEIDPLPSRRGVVVRTQLSNSLVHDRFGVPIDMPAKDVEVTATWYRNNEPVLRKSVDKEENIALESVENGDAHVLTLSFDTPEEETFWDVAQLEPENVDEGKIVPGLGPYSVRLSVTYTFDAEAAFTKSSRWRSGNNLLKVWRNDAWRERSLDFRNQWEQANCDTVRKYGTEFERQRTAALTTPVTPVMYTHCGTALFSSFGENVGTVPISISAVGPEGGKDVQSFAIQRGATNCRGSPQEIRKTEGENSIVWEDVGMGKTYSPGLGWGVNPKIVERGVTIDGERTAISCSVNLSIRTQLKPRIQRDIELPGFGAGEQRGLHEFDWQSLSISSDGSSATLTFNENLDIDSLDTATGPFDVTRPEGAGLSGGSISDPLTTVELSLSGVESGDEVTIAIINTVRSEDGNAIRLEKCTAPVGGASSACGPS